MSDFEEENNGKTMPQKNIMLYLHDLIYLLAAIVLIFTICFRIVVVSGPSMYNTLVDGDFLLLLSNTLYHNQKQGDIVVVSKDSFDNGTPIVKRIIATEGQTVDIDFKTGTVRVDGEVLSEPYTHSPTTNFEGMTFPLTVEEGCIFVLGDNRMDSKDSRDPEIGLIDQREVLGRAIFLFIPGNNQGRERADFSRIGVVS